MFKKEIEKFFFLRSLTPHSCKFENLAAQLKKSYPQEPRRRFWEVYEDGEDFPPGTETFNEACQNCGEAPVNEYGLCARCDQLWDEGED